MQRAELKPSGEAPAGRSNTWLIGFWLSNDPRSVTVSIGPALLSISKSISVAVAFAVFTYAIRKGGGSSCAWHVVTVIFDPGVCAGGGVAGAGEAKGHAATSTGAIISVSKDSFC